ncbi:MAG: LytR C-terminal domain-containing protein [Deltaproteobacteria bacterium]|nr:LytR C-terminal domain-containing protein [Deltaproteobacteria bacterium]
MFRASAFIFVLSVCFVLLGCSTIQHLDGTSDEEMKIFKMNKKEIYSDLKKSEVENERLQKQIDIVTEQNRSLNTEVDRSRKDNQRLTRENETLRMQLAEIQENVATPAFAEPKNERNIGRLKIKVLSGNGDLTSAKSVAEKLRGMGYRIQMIDRAPRSDFDNTTIYFAPNREDEAGHLMFNMGGNPVLKPLSWPTEFDLIVVTGPRP